MVIKGAQFTVEYTMVYTPWAVERGNATSHQESPQTLGNAHASMPSAVDTTTSIAPNIVEFASPPANPEEGLDVDHDDAPLRFRTIGNVLRPASPCRLTLRVLDSELLFTTADEPTLLSEAEQHECWHHVMLDMMKPINYSDTWELVDLPAGHRAFMVMKGYVQCLEINFKEVFILWHA